jgi:hypothetical protein
MYYLALIIGAALAAFLIFMLVREFSAIRGPKAKPEAQTSYKPSLRASAKSQLQNFQLSLKSTGSYTSESVYMECAIYRISYQFPQDVKVKVDLVSTDGKSRKTIIVNKAGYNSSTFNVEMSKYYVFEVEPAQADAHWALIIKPF